MMPSEGCGRITQLFYKRLHQRDSKALPAEILRSYNSLLFYDGKVGPDNF